MVGVRAHAVTEQRAACGRSPSPARPFGLQHQNARALAEVQPVAVCRKRLAGTLAVHAECGKAGVGQGIQRIDAAADDHVAKIVAQPFRGNGDRVGTRGTGVGDADGGPDGVKSGAHPFRRIAVQVALRVSRVGETRLAVVAIGGNRLEPVGQHIELAAGGRAEADAYTKPGKVGSCECRIAERFLQCRKQKFKQAHFGKRFLKSGDGEDRFRRGFPEKAANGLSRVMQNASSERIETGVCRCDIAAGCGNLSKPGDREGGWFNRRHPFFPVPR